MNSTFLRNYELEDNRGELKFHQLIEGDVNCVVWDASIALAKYLEQRSKKDPNWLRGREVVELGAGVGCVGLVAATYGAHVTLTDQPKALALLEFNIQSNIHDVRKTGGTAVARILDWTDNNVSLLPCDILLMSDCVYYRESIKSLVNTMTSLTKENSEIILSQEYRSYSEEQKKVFELFSDEVLKYFNVNSISTADQHEDYVSPDIKLLVLQKK